MSSPEHLCHTRARVTDASAVDKREQPGSAGVEYRTLFQLSCVPMWVSDPATARILAVNDAALRELGETSGAVIGQDYRELLNAALVGNPNPWLCATKQGRLLELTLTIAPELQLGRHRAQLIVGREVTRSDGSEHALRRRNAELAARVSTMAQRLETTSKEFEAFSYSISHDLRAPLRSIAGFARMLLERHSVELTADGQRLLGIVCDETGRMGTLIDDLLAYSRVTRQELHPAQINMTDLAQSAFQTLTESTPVQRVRLELGVLPEGCGDRTMVRQVFTHLLGNAIKFSSRQAAPVIELSGHGEADRTIYTVKDNGVGFDPRYADRLFGVFQRLHSQSEFEGTGIGLALTQRIIQRHGGAVWAQGAVNAGASFSFSLPRSPAAAALPI